MNEFYDWLRQHPICLLAFWWLAGFSTFVCVRSARQEIKNYWHDLKALWMPTFCIMVMGVFVSMLASTMIYLVWLLGKVIVKGLR